MQGVAEVLPVSSSAQLSLLPWLLRWPPVDDRTGFAAALHAGSCVGLTVALRHDLADLDRRTAGWLVLSAVPAALVGTVGHGVVEERLGGPGPTAGLLAGAGLLLWVADRTPERRAVGSREVAAAAVAQVVALIPGVSRSGATLTVLRALGVNRQDALRFSMLMSLPVTAGAAGLTVLRSGRRPPPVPTLLAGVSALAVATALDRGSARLAPSAALYRLGLATAVAVRLRRESR